MCNFPFFLSTFLLWRILELNSQSCVCTYICPVKMWKHKPTNQDSILFLKMTTLWLFYRFHFGSETTTTATTSIFFQPKEVVLYKKQNPRENDLYCTHCHFTRLSISPSLSCFLLPSALPPSHQFFKTHSCTHDYDFWGHRLCTDIQNWECANAKRTKEP